jgi:hypothetical protein
MTEKLAKKLARLDMRNLDNTSPDIKEKSEGKEKRIMGKCIPEYVASIMDWHNSRILSCYP